MLHHYLLLISRARALKRTLRLRSYINAKMQTCDILRKSNGYGLISGEAFIMRECMRACVHPSHSLVQLLPRV
jgi:hypothetical protein